MLRDALGRSFSCSRALSLVDQEYQLLDDKDNIAKRHRDKSPAELRALPEKDRLARRQAAHLAVSIKATSPEDFGRLEIAVGECVASEFASTEGRFAGFPVFWALHDDHGARPHAHLVVGTSQLPGFANGGRARSLRLGPDDLEFLRQEITTRLVSMGVDVIATRKCDRPEWRRDLIDGRVAELESSERVKKGRQRDSAGVVAPGLDRLIVKRAPKYAAKYADEMLLREYRTRVDGPDIGNPKKQTVAPSNPPNRLLGGDDLVRALYGDEAPAARARIVELASEADDELALWLMRNRPKVFGRPVGDPAEIVPERAGRRPRRLVWSETMTETDDAVILSPADRDRITAQVRRIGLDRRREALVDRTAVELERVATRVANEADDEYVELAGGVRSVKQRFLESAMQGQRAAPVAGLPAAGGNQRIVDNPRERDAGQRDRER